MATHPQHTPPGLLRIVRTTGDAARTEQLIRLLGVEHTETAIRAHGLRTALHGASVLAPAMPWLRRLYNEARNAAEDPGAGTESLRRGLEAVVRLAADRQAPKVFALVRPEMGAVYRIER